MNTLTFIPFPTPPSSHYLPKRCSHFPHQPSSHHLPQPSSYFPQNPPLITYPNPLHIFHKILLTFPTPILLTFPTPILLTFPSPILLTFPSPTLLILHTSCAEFERRCSTSWILVHINASHKLHLIRWPIVNIMCVFWGVFFQFRLPFGTTCNQCTLHFNRKENGVDNYTDLTR